MIFEQKDREPVLQLYATGIGRLELPEFGIGELLHVVVGHPDRVPTHVLSVQRFGEETEQEKSGNDDRERSGTLRTAGGPARREEGGRGEHGDHSAWTVLGRESGRGQRRLDQSFGDHGEAELLLDLVKHLQSLLQAGSPVIGGSTSIVLLVGTLKNQREVQPGGTFGEVFGGPHHDLPLFDHAGTGDEDQVFLANVNIVHRNCGYRIQLIHVGQIPFLRILSADAIPGDHPNPGILTGLIPFIVEFHRRH
jgi:hypothetical protein